MMKFLSNKKSNNKKDSFVSGRGFTMIELIIAVGIFVIIVVIVTSLLITSLKGQRKTFALQNAQDNARFLIGFMA